MFHMLQVPHVTDITGTRRIMNTQAGSNTNGVLDDYVPDTLLYFNSGAPLFIFTSVKLAMFKIKHVFITK